MVITALTAAYIICMSETHLQERSPWLLKYVAAMNSHIEGSEMTVLSGGGNPICIWKTLGQIERVETIHTRIKLEHVKILLNPVILVLCTYKPPDTNLKVYTAQLCRHLPEKVPLLE